MATKPSWDGKTKQFEKMMLGNGFTKKHQKGSHITWVRNSDVIVLGDKGHLRNELIWNMIRKFKINWEPYI